MSHAALHAASRYVPAAGFAPELEPPTPVQVREWVSDLFKQDRITLAVALAEAGLALYPDSEDVLVIAALVAQVQQDWPHARQLLEHLIAVQAGDSPAEVFCHLIRVLRCQHDDAAAQARLAQALARHPNDTHLLALRQELACAADAPPGTEPANGRQNPGKKAGI